MCLRETVKYIIAMSKNESLVHLTEALLHSLRLEAKAVEPDVVLSQAHVDVVGVISVGSRQEGLDDCRGAD